ncbi:Transcription termination factor MTEF1, chloroplastic [Linum grandiflorum]
MQETLNLFSAGKLSIPCSNSGNFPSQNREFHSLCRPRIRIRFRTLSFKTIATAVSPPPRPAPPPNPSADFQEKLYYLDSIGLDVFSLVTNHRPILFAASLPEIQATVDYLTSMGLKSQDFRRIVSMCPEILSTSLSSVISVFTFLLREAGVTGSRIRKVIHRRPRLLVSSVKDQLRPTLYFIQSIGIASTHRHTYLLSCSVEGKLIPRIQYFEAMGLSYREATGMFRRFPQLFNYSLKENVEPKLNYFVVEMGRELKELKEFPQFFSFSLEGRIKPRHQRCVELGFCLPLPLLLKARDEEFRERLERFGESTLPLCSSPLYRIRVDFDYLMS